MFNALVSELFCLQTEASSVENRHTMAWCIVSVSVVVATLSYTITPVTAAGEAYDAAATVNWYIITDIVIYLFSHHITVCRCIAESRK